MLLLLNWNNEHFVDWVKRLSCFIWSPASLSLSAGFKQFILISDFEPSVVNCCCATSSNTWETIVRLFQVVGAHSRAISFCETWPSLMTLRLADSEEDKHFKGEEKYQIGYFSSEKVVEIFYARIKNRRKKSRNGNSYLSVWQPSELLPRSVNRRVSISSLLTTLTLEQTVEQKISKVTG